MTRLARLLLITAVIIALGVFIPRAFRKNEADIERLVAARMDPSTKPQFYNVRRDEVLDNEWCGEVTGKDAFEVPVDHLRFTVYVGMLGSVLIEFDKPENRDSIDKLCGGARSHPSQWVSVSKAQNGVEEFTDIANIRVDNNIRRARIKSVYAPQSVRDPNDPNKWWASAESQRAFNCKDSLSRRESMTVYFSDGTDVSVPDKSLPTPWEPVRPDTMLSEDINFICAWNGR